MIDFQFLCVQNIKLFLSVCKDYFEIQEVDLFEPETLYEVTKFYKVLTTLSKLSLCNYVRKNYKHIQ